MESALLALFTMFGVGFTACGSAITVLWRRDIKRSEQRDEMLAECQKERKECYDQIKELNHESRLQWRSQWRHAEETNGDPVPEDTKDIKLKLLGSDPELDAEKEV